MNPRRLLQVSTGLMGFFLIAHTLGAMAGPRDAAEASMFAAMQGYRFDIMGVNRTHWDFYQGLNWYLSAALVVFVALHINTLGLMARQPSAAARPLLLSMALGLVLFAVVSWRYFFPAPLVMTTLSAACLLLAARQLRGRP
jgi:cell division protein FtsW (lipid II flippase)